VGVRQSGKKKKQPIGLERIPRERKTPRKKNYRQRLCEQRGKSHAGIKPLGRTESAEAEKRREEGHPGKPRTFVVAGGARGRSSTKKERKRQKRSPSLEQNERPEIENGLRNIRRKKNGRRRKA